MQRPPVRTSLIRVCLLAGLITVGGACASSKFVAPASRSAVKRTTTSRSTASRSGSRTGTSAKTGSTLKVVNSTVYVSQYAREVINQARTYTGTPYVSGGNTYDGIDCSGLICAAFSSVGLKMPRISWQQSEVGYEVEVAEIRPGDLVFFVPESGKEGYVSHAAIVTEVRGPNDIRFIHASSSRGVREDNLYSTYFKGRFVKALRPF
ncbi:C40 family peptidase [Fibrella aquatilis]|uniref:C40 family peptidase n=1 Tax=Fibrella aquatilis TaxID=2817059 RepID=A0A939G4G9_9BACT|nr:C40 family peptidase [Fibrella aquatilis]MBO0931726.1 C40 family peptidase [Fibrella aquatilis]